jgi:CRP/FNR family transcriptional regulator, cyclic AMP receptor protein
MTSSNAAALKSMNLCRTLSSAEIDTIAAIAETRDVPAGREIFREGEPGDGLFLVVSGEIDIVKQSSAGARSLAHLGAGSILGEISLLTSEARSATGRALVDTKVLHLPMQAFRQLHVGGSTAALKVVAAIAEVLSRRLATMNVKVVELAGKLEGGAEGQPGAKEKELADLHRAMHIWSF